MANVNHRARLRGAMSLAFAAVALVACNRDKILTVTDPDIINPSNLGSAEAAEALRVGALSTGSDVTGGLQGRRSLDASNNIVYGNPQTNVQIYTRAIATFDTALQNAPAGDARADTVKWLVAIEKARVQLDLGDVTGAGTTISAVAVPDNFKFTMFYTQALG